MNCKEKEPTNSALKEKLGETRSKSVHEKKKPFKCEICGYSFSRKSNMTQHVLSVHEEKKPFKCNNCHYSCSEKGSLTKHVASVHDKKFRM